MSKVTPVVNLAGDYEETILQLAKHLGRAKIRRRVFDEVYGRSRKFRSKKEIMAAAGIVNRGNKSQQVQNALEHLYKYHLIARKENEGQTKDGSRFIYGKDESVRAHKDRIRRYADDRQLASKVPTKRRQLLQGSTSVRGVTRTTLRRRKQLTVLYLAASPDSANPLRLDAEGRQVQDAIRGSKYRDNISIEYRPAADIQSILDGLNDHCPQIVHFSGHGYQDGISTDSGRVSKTAPKDLSFDLLAKALGATDSPPAIIVLNSCESTGAQKSFLPPGKILIAMKKTISDIAASAFAVQFYAGIASGQSVQSAFNQGVVAIESASIVESDTPALLHAAGVMPSSIVLT